MEIYNHNCNQIAADDDGCESYRSQIIWESNSQSLGYIYLKVRGFSAQNYGGYTLAYQRTDPVITYTVSTQSNPATAGTTTGGGSYNSGEQCTVSATPNQNYSFTNWTENGTIVSGNTNYTFSVNGNRVLLANFTCILPSPVIVAGGGTFCGSAILSASGGTGGTIYFQGTNSNGTSTAVQANSYAATESGTYYFRAYNGICWGTAGSATVTINSIPGTVSVSGGGTHCGSALLTATGGAGGTMYFQGTNSNGTSTATQATSRTVTESGTYYFRSYNGQCWSLAGSVSVTVINIPNTPFISLFDNVLHSDAEYGNQWHNENGTINGAINQTYVVNETGTYYVVVSNSGCSSAPSNSIYVSVSGVETKVANDLILYPNPANHELFIALVTNDLPFQYTIINSIGQVVAKGSTINYAQVNILNLANGIYLVKVEQDSKAIFKRFLKL